MTNDPRPNAPAMLASGMVLGLILFLVAAIYGSFTIIQPGNVGVVFNRWSGALKTVGQGVAWRVPWVTQVQSYPVALRTYTMVQRGAESWTSPDAALRCAIASVNVAPIQITEIENWMWKTKKIRIRGGGPSKIRLSTPYYLLRKDVGRYLAAFDEYKKGKAAA